MFYKNVFSAMASPCEILLYSDVAAEKIEHDVQKAIDEVARIEKTYSRYRTDNIIYQINQGEKIKANAELTELLNFSQTAFELSNGLFDITSGILRKIWAFSGETITPPTEQTIKNSLSRIGWHQVSWQPPYFQLAPGMEIDFGGIGKEYAADKAAALLLSLGYSHFLVNLGGDIAAHTPTDIKTAWQVGIESPNHIGEAATNVELKTGGLATSGHTYRYFLLNNKRYGHILNPKTGWPVENSLTSLTVLADNCTQAGFLATLGLLQGEHAEAFLAEHHIQSWYTR